MALLLLFASSMGMSCEKETMEPTTKPGTITGKVTDASGKPLQGVKVTAEHTLWHSTYVLAETDQNGQYKIVLPDQPAGTWTVKAQWRKAAYGQKYVFDLDGLTTPVASTEAAVRNFTWKLSGPKAAGNTFYGAHLDLYAFGVDVPLNEIKLVLTPVESVLIDGSPATAIERVVEEVAGTYMVKDIPIGRYFVQALYPGKTFLLDNRHQEDAAETTKPVVFGKNGLLAETEYNIEFWISE